MIKTIRRLFFRLFPRYRTIEVLAVNYLDAYDMIRNSADKPEAQRWQISLSYKARTQLPGYFVFIERRERITE